jgi:hypothetical protein
VFTTVLGSKIIPGHDDLGYSKGCPGSKTKSHSGRPGGGFSCSPLHSAFFAGSAWAGCNMNDFFRERLCMHPPSPGLNLALHPLAAPCPRRLVLITCRQIVHSSLSCPGHDHRRLLHRSIRAPSSSKQACQLDRPTRYFKLCRPSFAGLCFSEMNKLIYVGKD